MINMLVIKRYSQYLEIWSAKTVKLKALSAYIRRPCSQKIYNIKHMQRLYTFIWYSGKHLEEEFKIFSLKRNFSTPPFKYTLKGHFWNSLLISQGTSLTLHSILLHLQTHTECFKHMWMRTVENQNLVVLR